MKKILIFMILIPAIAQSQSLDSGPKVKIEPLYGIETAMVRFPEPARMVTRATYGARFLYGTTLLSGELEISQAKSREDYPALSQKVEDTSDRAALGIRTTLPFNQYVSAFFRAGGRATQGKTIVTTSGVDETRDNPLRLDPYAGAGVQLSLASIFSVNAGVTLVRNSENTYDSQFTLGFSASFGNP